MARITVPPDAITEPLDAAMDLSGFTPRLLALLSHAITRRESRELRRVLRLGTTDWRVLSALAVYPGAPSTRLSEVTALDKAVVSRCVAGLLEGGLVVVGDGPRGSRPLWLTAEGADVHAVMMPISLQAQELIERTLPARQVAQLNAALTTLIAALDEPGAWPGADTADHGAPEATA